MPNMPNQRKKLVTVSAFVAIGIPRGTVYKMVKECRIPVYRTGSKGRGLRFDLDEALAVLHQPAASTVKKG